nr:NACHT, LRR and PYD domains-containing protein 10 [Gorilla gorilla gorilla]XP_055212463.1 NACHT, LRR and PYD domains-containing protein 10 [Gorilla gorilla gorilla]XP_055212464.1 NACHT, LRR and PYD domains-containing protein 10 [Gorilla gorilla gorilla]XP_055212465.1 NACHT, LRR and PYD domains-containing protein 10 [Gorilla gorilla gorilla]XP_055212467.1 NACHT, LRR and PYD domains-containing protein 10 [Gorilla gorilla gorilla]
MAMAKARNPREALLWALSDLEENDFKKLKFYLRDMTLSEGQPPLARGELEGLIPVDLAELLISKYGEKEAVKVVLKGLKVMNLLELVDQLSHICLHDYREVYREHVRCLEEWQEAGVNGRYNQVLLVAKPSSESPESLACPIPEQELDSVTVEALFDSGEKPSLAPSLVVLQGSAGTGKTTLARKMVLDWATGTLYPGRFDYVFYVSCKEVVLLLESKLEQLLFWCCGDNQAPVTEILRQPERLLFILDGFDELQRPFEEKLKKRGLSPKESLLHLLIRRHTLPTCSLLITTRPLALRNLEPLLKQARHVHILGFSEEERARYFSSYFTDEKQADRAFDIVQKNDILYKACQVPGICWVVCSWLQGQMERGKVVLETPRNSTDIFMAYVSTFLPPDDDGGCSELSRHRVLRSLCSLAAEGIQHQRFLFEEAELRKHNLDGPRLAAFLSSNDYQLGLAIKKFYSFRHVSFQDFFHAMSYLVKEDQSRLGKESRREVQRLLEVKEQEGNDEMTLTMQFLLDILKKDSFSNLELKFCFRISPCLAQDLKHFKEQMESMKHNRTWDLEFSLYEAKIKNLVKGIQMNNVSFKIKHSNEKKSQSQNLFSVKSSLSHGPKEEQKCPSVHGQKEGKDNIAGKPKEASTGKGRGTEETDEEVRCSGMGSREMGAIMLKGWRNEGVTGRTGRWGKTDKVKKDGERRIKTNGYKKE